MSSTSHTHYHPPNIPMNPATTQELDSLNEQRNKLQIDRSRIVAKQDFWHGWATGLGVFAALIGVFAGASAYLESRKSYALRPIDSEISAVDGNIADWKKRDADFKISQLNEKAAGLEVEAAGLRLETAKLGSRVKLFEAAEENLKSVALAYPRQKAEIRYGTAGANPFGLATNSDAFVLANSLQLKFGVWGWRVPPAIPDEFNNCGLFVLIRSHSSSDTKRAAEALAAAMFRASLSQAKRPLTDDSLKALPRFPLTENGEIVQFPQFDDDTIVVQVCDHP